jgi:hypoxanthine phosphoribosyltransferase
LPERALGGIITSICILLKKEAATTELQFEKTMAEYGMDRLAKKKGAVLVGFSGGADSSCLLALMKEWTGKNGTDLYACHVNHLIRGEEADADQHFCEKMCRDLDIPLFVYRLDVPAYAEKNRLGIEEAARKLRYGAFGKALGEIGMPAVIATAHNADDNLETVIFNMMRGSGTRGMAGISPVRDGRFIRPLIKDGSDEIREWCREHGISYVTDSTNSDESLSRNLIRRRLIPEIKKVTGAGLDSFSRMTDIVRKDSEFLDGIAAVYLPGRMTRIGRRVLQELDPAISSRIVRKMYSNLKGTPADLSAYHTEKALEICRGTSENSLDLPGDVVFRADRNIARVVKRVAADTVPPENRYLYSEDAPVFDNSRYRVEFIKGEIPEKTQEALAPDENIYKLSIISTVRFDKIIGRLMIRSKADGDTYRYGGMTRKVKKLLNSRKLTSREKELYPVVCDDEGILWIPGFPPRDGVRFEGEGEPLSLVFRDYAPPGSGAENNENGGRTMERHSILDRDIEEVLVTQEQVDEITTRIAEEIDRDYADSKRLILLCILKGSVVFMGDLMKKVRIPVEIDFMKVSSYASGTKTTGRINILLDLNRSDLSECDILIVEDIIDSGRTLSYLSEYLALNGAHSVKTCTLLDKPSRREVDFTPDYRGLEIPDKFVVGYGLDYAEQYRALPYIGVLKPEVYSKK